MLTRKNKSSRAITLKNCDTKFKYVRCGATGNVRTLDCSGCIPISDLSENKILGCDWYGSLAIYFHMNPHNRLIQSGTEFYFMLPETDGTGRVKTGEQTVFLSIFHHIHNTLLLTDPLNTPPFQTPMQEKYEFLRTRIQHMEKNDLASILDKIQMAVQFKAYASFDEFIEIFENPWHEYTALDPIQRIELLNKFVAEPNELIEFLCSPIEIFKNFTLKVLGEFIWMEKLCALILHKLDCHEIYIKTGVKPLAVNWLQELDVILKVTK